MKRVDAKRVGELLFLSGIGPRKPGTGEIPGIIRDGAGSSVIFDKRGRPVGLTFFLRKRKR